MKKNLGVMLDCSRNAVMSVVGLKKLIVYLEKLGYTFLQLYTEDTYEIAEEPLFGKFRGRYSKAEIKELDAYAKEHHIQLVPCIQTLAHLNQIFYWDKFHEIKDSTDVLLVGEEKTKQFIENMFKNIAECYSARIINIGMDEAGALGTGKYFHKHGYRPKYDILLEHLQTVSDIAKKYGFTLLMWSDMFFRLVNKGDYYGEAEVPEEIKKQIPDNVQLIYWDYYSEDKSIYDRMIKGHLGFGRDMWMASGAWKWIGFQAGNEKSFRVLKPAIQACQQHNVDNIIVTLWGDDGNECPVYAILPALIYASECAKGNFDLEQAQKTMQEVFGENWDDFMLLDLKPSSMPIYRDCATGAKELFYSDCFLGKFDATVSGTGEESAIYAKYAKLFEQAKIRSKNFGYVFESYEKLSRTLAIKYELGYRTRKAYQAKDTKELQNIVKDYQITIMRMEDFLSAFRNMWFMDNKPHGFDVQDIRIGGTLQRLKSCKQRLELYLNGEVDVLEELEESLDNVLIGEDAKRIPQFNFYRQIATLNSL